MPRVTVETTLKGKSFPVPPLRDTIPHGDHSERTWAVAATIRERLIDGGFALPRLRR